MGSASQEEINGYIRRYKTGRTLIILSLLLFFIFLGYLFYFIFTLPPSASNPTQTTSPSLNFILLLLEVYFPILMAGMFVLIYIGLYFITHSIQNFIGKPRIQISLLEYQKEVLEFKKIMRQKKSEKNSDFSTDSSNVNDSNNELEEGTSPFSKK
jgi:hypothetical protein